MLQRYFQIFLKRKSLFKYKLLLLLVILDGQRLKGTVLDILCIKKNNQKAVAKYKAKKEESERWIEENYTRLVHTVEVKQILKLVIPLTELCENTGSPKNCTGCGICMCIPQINTCKMMNRSEMMCHVTVLRLQIPGRSCVPFWLTALCVSRKFTPGKRVISFYPNVIETLPFFFSLFLFLMEKCCLFCLQLSKLSFRENQSHLEWVVVLSFSGFFPQHFVQKE